jgi:hypothetical protein
LWAVLLNNVRQRENGRDGPEEPGRRDARRAEKVLELERE